MAGLISINYVVFMSALNNLQNKTSTFQNSAVEDGLFDLTSRSEVLTAYNNALKELLAVSRSYANLVRRDSHRFKSIQQETLNLDNQLSRGFIGSNSPTKPVNGPQLPGR